MPKAQDLKRLQTQRRQLRMNLAKPLTDAKRADLDKDLDYLDRRIATIEGGTANVVSEHAILRWLERVKGMDTKAVEREMFGETNPTQVMGFIKHGRVPLPGGGVGVIKGGVMVTVTRK